MLVNRFLPRPTAVPLLTSAVSSKKKLQSSTHNTTSFSSIPTALTSSSLSTCRPLLLSLSPVRLCISKFSLVDLPKVIVSEAELDEDPESEDDEFGNGIMSEGGGLKEINVGTSPNKAKLPNLSIKEKKELASYAHSLGKKLKSQQVGKSGVTDNVIMALVETLEANELLKLKIHNNCPGEMEDVVKHLEAGTGSVVVGQIGRTVILYRPSLSKLKAEEKKRVNRIFMQRPSTFKLAQQSKTPVPNKPASHGRRGSSRFSA